MSSKKHLCPVCGFIGFSQKPYKDLPSSDGAISESVSLPYTDKWGEPLDESCNCCGFNPHSHSQDQSSMSFADLLDVWVQERHLSWHDVSFKPQSWDFLGQLSEAKLTATAFIYNHYSYDGQHSSAADGPFYCPVCGYKNFASRPYRNMPDKVYPLDQGVTPPYEEHWGCPSYEICDCCYFEPGNSDHDFSGAKSFDDIRKEWAVDDNLAWSNEGTEPENWDIIKQLKEAGIPIPAYIHTKFMLK